MLNLASLATYLSWQLYEIGKIGFFACVFHTCRNHSWPAEEEARCQLPGATIMLCKQSHTNSAPKDNKHLVSSWLWDSVWIWMILPGLSVIGCCLLTQTPGGQLVELSAASPISLSSRTPWDIFKTKPYMLSKCQCSYTRTLKSLQICKHPIHQCKLHG